MNDEEKRFWNWRVPIYCCVHEIDFLIGLRWKTALAISSIQALSAAHKCIPYGVSDSEEPIASSYSGLDKVMQPTGHANFINIPKDKAWKFFSYKTNYILLLKTNKIDTPFFPLAYTTSRDSGVAIAFVIEDSRQVHNGTFMQNWAIPFRRMRDWRHLTIEKKVTPSPGQNYSLIDSSLHQINFALTSLSNESVFGKIDLGYANTA